jgi:hypothetical protein
MNAANALATCVPGEHMRDGLGPGAPALHLQHDAAAREEEVGQAGGLPAIHFCWSDSNR